MSIIHKTFPIKINNFTELFDFLELGVYDLERYSKKVDINITFKHCKNINDLFLKNYIDYQMLQDLKLFYETK